MTVTTILLLLVLAAFSAPLLSASWYLTSLARQYGAPWYAQAAIAGAFFLSGSIWRAAVLAALGVTPTGLAIALAITLAYLA